MPVRSMQAARVCLLVFLASFTLHAEGVGISSITRSGQITWTNAYPVGVMTVEVATNVLGPYLPATNHFTTNLVGASQINTKADAAFARLLAVDISTNTPRHYTNLIESYGTLETIAGTNRNSADKTSHWLPQNEGGWATNANLSRPHVAFGDPQGNILIVDQGSASVLKVTPAGRIYTYAGTHTNGFNGDGPDYATNLSLRFPNGGWMRGDGTFYVLDTENGRVRRIDTNQVMTTLITVPMMGDGRALWVRNDESEIYFGSGPSVGGNVTTLNRWTPTGGVTVVRSSFLNLGNVVGDEATGDLYLSDRNANRVYRMDTNGNLRTIAGNGTPTGSGGEGFPATESSLYYPRSIWFLPNRGFLIGEHDPGNRIWYVDPEGILHRWMNGDSSNNYREGDGKWFYENPNLAKVSRVRSVVTDHFGNIIIVESNFGYVRRINFQRLQP